MDLNRKPKKDVALWNETRWVGCFNPEQGVGIFIHVGRLRGNLDWWWAQTVVFLPGGQIAADRSWGRDLSELGVKTPNLELRVETNGWSARFDGIVELTDTQGMSRGPRGASAPNAYVCFELTSDGSRPAWDMYAKTVGQQDFAGDMHIEQMGRSTGTLQVGSDHYRLDGVAGSDHSCGVRDLTLFHSYDFINLAMPDSSIHALLVLGPGGESRATLGVWIAPNGKQHKLEAASIPRPIDFIGTPRECDLVLKPEGMDQQVLRIQIVHTFAYTVTNDNDNINGVDWEVVVDPLICVESVATVTAADGSVGHGVISRGARRSNFVKESFG